MMENSFFKRFETLFNVLEFILIISVISASAYYFPGSFHEKAKKQCVANMKTIEGATELYQIENGTQPAIDIPLLVQTGYLKTAPYCPDGGTYRVQIGGHGGAVITDVECRSFKSHGLLSRLDPGEPCRCP